MSTRKCICSFVFSAMVGTMHVGLTHAISLNRHVKVEHYPATFLRKDRCSHDYMGKLEKPPWLGRSNSLGNVEFKKILFSRNVFELQTLVKTAEPRSLLPAAAGATVAQTAEPLQDANAIFGWNFKNFSIDLCKKQVTVQAGVTWSEVAPVLEEVSKATLVLPTYLMYKNVTLIGLMSTSAVGVGLGQPKMGLGNWVTQLRVVNGKGEDKTIVVKRNPELASFWLSSIGVGGFVVEATIELLPAHFIVSKVWSQPTGGPAHNFMKIVEESKLLDPSSESVEGFICVNYDDLCPLTNMSSVQSRPTTYDGPIDTSPVDQTKMGLILPGQMILNGVPPPTVLGPNPRREFPDLPTFPFNKTYARSVTVDQSLDIIWNIPRDQPLWMALYVPPADFYTAMDLMQQAREETGLKNILALVANHRPDKVPILLGHDSYSIEILTFVGVRADNGQIFLDKFKDYCISWYKKMVCEHKIKVGWHLGDYFPLELMGAREAPWPSRKALKRFKEIEMQEDPDDKFTSTAVQALSRRLSENAPSIC